LVKVKPANIRRKNLGEKHFNVSGSFSNDSRLIRLFKVNKVNTSMANAKLNGLAVAYIHKPTDIDGTSVLEMGCL